MTTKAPSAVKPAPPDSLEHIAYASVSGIPTAELHDLDRLGYYVYTWLKQRNDPLEMVLKTAQVRMQISEEEALGRIRKALTEHGIAL
jgi:hypothetical protein